LNKFLIIQTSFIGDVILTLPLLQVLRRNFPNSKIDFILIPRTAELLKNHPDINDVIVFDKRGRDSGISGLMRLRKILSAENYDVALIPHRSFRSAFLALISGIGERIGFDKSSAKFLYTHIVEYKNIHEIERNLSLLIPLGIRVDRKELPNLYPSDDDINYVDSLLSSYGIKNLIGISPGSIWATKRWLKEGFSDVASKFTGIGFDVALIGGVDDFMLCEEIKTIAGGKNVFNFCGKLSLLQSAELISRCKVLITNDSAPMHMAVAVGTPVVAIFGSTVPEFGFYPYGEKDIVVQVDNLYCRPCGIHGHGSCPEGHFKCMKLIKSEDVFKKAMSLIQGY
jgi:heptosyltransferase-2